MNEKLTLNNRFFLDVLTLLEQRQNCLKNKTQKKIKSNFKKFVIRNCKLYFCQS